MDVRITQTANSLLGPNPRNSYHLNSVVDNNPEKVYDI